MAEGEGTYSYEGLDKKYIEKAKKELNENPEQVHAHIESFRRWVRSQPHITCPTDDAFLLRFLRWGKFEHAKAQRRLDNFCTVRASPRGNVEAWFKYPDTIDQEMENLIRMFCYVPLGQNEKGEQVFIAKMGNIDYEKLPLDKMFIAMYMSLDVAVSDEMEQISGMSVIIDLSLFSRRDLTFWSSQKGIKDSTRVWQDSYPIRTKDIFYYKEPLIFDILYRMFEIWLNPKMRSRIHRLKDDFSKIFSKMSGSKAIIPKEYGGDNPLTVDELRDAWIEKVKAYYAKGNPLGGIRVDESKRPEITLKYLAQYEDYKSDELMTGTVGTFTKLNV